MCRESGISSWSLKTMFGLLSHEAERVMGGLQMDALGSAGEPI